jgi:predicted nucleic acid-binding protein
LSAVLLDTGVIVASLDRSERFHARCADAIADTTSALVTCEAVIAESCYLLRNLNGAAEAVVANVAAGIFQVPFSLTRSAEPVRDVLRKYSHSGIDFADACLIQLATDLRIPDILTLDRDFEHYRWGRNNAFRMLVPLDGR